MNITFDPDKDEANRARHGVSLADAAGFEWETALVDPRLQALILDANSLTLAQLQSLQDAYLSCLLVCRCKPVLFHALKTI